MERQGLLRRWVMESRGGRDHRVENNLFVDREPAVRMDGRGLDAPLVWRNMVRGCKLSAESALR